ncbi:3-phosphoshikimate 1-carboxyvinyltransferase [Pseudobacteriovorax antillogorgiicola]|uniref:3-phosphoshikimate 1-carboxyvinyltransferase n=1 Tax=Pseudobacteriovorax antillogorgiicola TaxID=1513793 RepID=A0A1Y6B7E4_9BACT|nr:3-phosphoshikimate 1-carboxyvinyltransferase [Pseudobacteriovorax antillogorgiicola]TCS58616.1 3-phosphoshikimate 1-carboxyvinyltransferase [Pseudobacteriovorax antillogorgiicola]SME96830.1 3-phosphoshikimate 1-carboxyvinyltransferase [Pseudobacteriovorax antillogorgiicola]
MTQTIKTITPLQDHGQTVESLCGRDKSLTHRAIMFSSLASGKSTIYSPLLGADCRSTMDCFRALGVSFSIEDDKILVSSPGWRNFKNPKEDLDCGNSGTTARLLTGLFASMPGLRCTLIGDESLSKRPMGRVTEPLRAIGGHYDGPDHGQTLPLTIEGQELRAAKHHIDKATAQVKSAILLAGLQIDGQTEVSLPKGSRDHTENMLRALGADCQTSIKGDVETVRLQGPFTIPSGNYHIPVDPSSAAFFAVLGLIRPKGRTVIQSMLDNPTRTGFFEVLGRMSDRLLKKPSESSDVSVEPTVDLEVEGSFPISGVEIEEALVPTLVDEIPILAVAAAFAKTPSHFKGLGELRVKESDRLEKTYELLTLAGCTCSIQGDDLFIQGGLSQSKVFTYDSEGDHRLAMAGAIMAKFAQGPCKIIDPDCVAVSFPNFYEELDKFES